MKFRRSWVAITVLAAFDVVFMIPAITTFQQAAAEWGRFDSLFDLVGALFLTAWLLGWSMGPLLMTTILLLLLFGREVLMVRDKSVVIFIGLPFIGVESKYTVSSMRNLRFERPPRKSGSSWRGTHLVFDYGANTVAVGSALTGDDIIDIRHHIQDASGQTIRRGEATEAELADDWEKPTGPENRDAPPESFAPTISDKPISLSSPSTLALIFANLAPLAGATLLGWDLGLVLVLYWAESAVIGFFNICKIAVIGRWKALLAAPFFAGHFGGFMAVHFLFVYGLFIQGPRDMSGGDLSEVMQMFTSLWPALALLFFSHALSFYSNFIGRKEYLTRTIQTQMSEPYRRIIFMHLVLIFGGGLTMVLGESTPVLMLVIAIKIWVDVSAHLKQRKPVGRVQPGH
ncbi:MAG: DUF6498-containing protein [Xanthomonadales bacterium]|nr:DUF6498-containing protein [Xanthomonadales bacterium]